MPELPEVETISRQLASVMRGEKCLEVEILDPKLKRSTPSEIVGCKLHAVRRIGKRVGFEFEGEHQPIFLAVHLRMTGQLIWVSSGKHLSAKEAMIRREAFGEVDNMKYVRARFRFKRGELLFHDVRRFGTFDVAASEADLLGGSTDPMSELFTPDLLAEMLQSTRQPLKHFLMRQDLIVGIGNIYASEILFDCRLSPLRAASSVRDQEVPRLFKSIRKILQNAIDRAGTTISDYRDSGGESGGYQSKLKVYDRKDAPCRRCKSSILRVVQQQRSTYYCPKCQPSKRSS